MDPRPDDSLRAELVAQLGWVQRLARAIVHDDGAAEDVAQDVARIALERREPILGSIGGLRAWLSVVARRLAIHRVRSDVARAKRERVASRAECEDETQEIVKRGARAHSVVEAVMQLDEPYRATVLMRYLEELSMADVARRTGVSEATARKRLSRGLEMLRARLDREHGDHGAWLAALVPFARAPVSGAVAGSGTALVLGGIAVSTKGVLLSGAVAVVALLAWIAWPDTEVSKSSMAESSSPTVDTLEGETPTVATRSEMGPTGAESARESLGVLKRAAPVSTVASHNHQWIVRGRITGAPAGRAAETKLSASFIGQFNIPEPVDALAAPDGTFAMDATALVEKWLRNAAPNELVLTAEHPVCLRAEVRAPFDSGRVDTSDPNVERTEYRCDVALTSAAVARGRVIVAPDWKPVKEEGFDLDRPRVGLFEFAGAEPLGEAGLDHASCGSDGRWTLRANRSGTFTVVAVAGGLRPTTLSVALVLGHSIEVDPLVLSRGASISGMVRRGGRAIGADARVVAQPKPQTSPRTSAPPAPMS